MADNWKYDALGQAYRDAAMTPRPAPTETPSEDPAPAPSVAPELDLDSLEELLQTRRDELEIDVAEDRITRLDMGREMFMYDQELARKVSQGASIETPQPAPSVGNEPGAALNDLGSYFAEREIGELGVSLEREGERLAELTDSKQASLDSYVDEFREVERELTRSNDGRGRTM